MASDLTGIIADLQQQRDAIERALSAVREIGGSAAAPAPAKRRGPAAGDEEPARECEGREREELGSTPAMGREESRRVRFGFEKAAWSDRSRQKRLSEMMNPADKKACV